MDVVVLNTRYFVASADRTQCGRGSPGPRGLLVLWSQLGSDHCCAPLKRMLSIVLGSHVMNCCMNRSGRCVHGLQLSTGCWYVAVVLGRPDGSDTAGQISSATAVA